MDIALEHQTSINNADPSFQPVYRGSVNIDMKIHDRTQAIYLKACGENISLMNFHGNLEENFRDIFGSAVVSCRPNESEELFEIFGNALAMQGYANGKPLAEEEMKKMLMRDAVRPFSGNPYTGFAVIHNQTGKVIGRAALGYGYELGQSQVGLILHPDFRGKGLGKEAAALLGSIAHVYNEKHIEMVKGEERAPLKSVCSTKRDGGDREPWVVSLGLKWIRPLTERENYSEDSRSLYGIEAEEIKETLRKLIDIEKLFCSIETV